MPTDRFTGVVHSVFRQACNIRTDRGGLLALLAPQLGNAPHGVRIELPSGLAFTDRLRAGQRVGCRAGVLRVAGADFAVDLSGAVRWRSALDTLAADLGRPEVALAWQAARQALASHRRHRGQVPLIDAVHARGLALARASRALSVDEAAAAIQRLIGCGPGLTPAGDDLIVGFLAGLWSAMGGDPARRRFLNALAAIVAVAAEATGEISRAYLRHATLGNVAEPLAGSRARSARVMPCPRSSGRRITRCASAIPRAATACRGSCSASRAGASASLAMARAERVVRNLYRNSVSLMQLSAKLGALAGVRQASAVMATAGNLALLREAGLAPGEVEAGPNDLLVALEGEDEAALAAALTAAEAELTRAPAAQEGGGPRRVPPKSLEMALGELPTANLALISTPGDYAAAEAMKALRLGLNVMLFSDNVALDGRDRAEALRPRPRPPGHGSGLRHRDPLRHPLGFANAVRRGDIGAVAASGTGLQQVTCLIDRWGQGISQAIGTGGHDLSAKVGGITMLQGLNALAADPDTRVVVLISKPPDPEVATRVLAAAEAAGKPIVVNFLGADPSAVRRPNVHPVRTLEDAARLAVALAGGANATGAAQCGPKLQSSPRGSRRGRDTSAGSTAAAPSATRRCCC